MSEIELDSTNEGQDNKLKIQMKLVKKIVQYLLIASKHKFPEILIYQITKYIFKNPLRFRKTLYSHNPSNQLKINTQYLLRRTSRKPQNRYPNQTQNQKMLIQEHSAKNAEKQKQKDKVWANKDKNLNEFAAYITVVRNFKAMKLDQSSYAQVLHKARHLFIFFGNIKLFSGKQNYKDNQTDPLKDFHNYQKKQKELNQYHHLICDSFQQYFSYFQSVSKYYKQKLMHPAVIKAFISLMSKNMALIKIEQNYNTQPLQCEAKYLYIESKEDLPLKFNRKLDQSSFPSLKNQKGQWYLVGQQQNYNFEVYEEVSYPLPWGRHSYITRYMTMIIKIDVWVEEEQQNH